MSEPIAVYLEVGQKHTFAGALAWPGWCRSGRNEVAALEALVAYGPRYAQLLAGTTFAFAAPADVAALTVVERLPGNPTTDFGAPDAAPADDLQPIDDAELQRFQTLLRACWAGFDAAVAAAAGHELRKGPRGGGRDIDGVVRHVISADRSYLGRLAWKAPRAVDDLNAELDQVRQAILNAVAATAHGETPAQGPRGGRLWPPRYMVRRVAWHLLDHLWEIEDRVI